MNHYEFWDGIIRDLSGAGRFRLILQPLMAMFVGLKLGIGDAKAGHAPFLLRLFTTSHGRWELLKQSLSDLAIPLIVAFVVDAILQKITLGYFRPLAAVVVGGILVWIPYTVARAVSNRIAKHTKLPSKPVEGAA